MQGNVKMNVLQGVLNELSSHPSFEDYLNIIDPSYHVKPQLRPIEWVGLVNESVDEIKKTCSLLKNSQKIPIDFDVATRLSRPITVLWSVAKTEFDSLYRISADNSSISSLSLVIKQLVKLVPYLDDQPFNPTLVSVLRLIQTIMTEPAGHGHFSQESQKSSTQIYCGLLFSAIFKIEEKCQGNLRKSSYFENCREHAHSLLEGLYSLYIPSWTHDVIHKIYTDLVKSIPFGKPTLKHEREPIDLTKDDEYYSPDNYITPLRLISRCFLPYSDGACVYPPMLNEGRGSFLPAITDEQFQELTAFNYPDGYEVTHLTYSQDLLDWKRKNLISPSVDPALLSNCQDKIILIPQHISEAITTALHNHPDVIDVEKNAWVASYVRFICGVNNAIRQSLTSTSDVESDSKGARLPPWLFKHVMFAIYQYTMPALNRTLSMIIPIDPILLTNIFILRHFILKPIHISKYEQLNALVQKKKRMIVPNRTQQQRVQESPHEIIDLSSSITNVETNENQHKSPNSSEVLVTETKSFEMESESESESEVEAEVVADVSIAIDQEMNNEKENEKLLPSQLASKRLSSQVAGHSFAAHETLNPSKKSRTSLVTVNVEGDDDKDETRPDEDYEDGIDKDNDNDNDDNEDDDDDYENDNHSNLLVSPRFKRANFGPLAQFASGIDTDKITSTVNAFHFHDTSTSSIGLNTGYGVSESEIHQQARQLFINDFPSILPQPVRPVSIATETFAGSTVSAKAFLSSGIDGIDGIEENEEVEDVENVQEQDDEYSQNRDMDSNLDDEENKQYGIMGEQVLSKSRLLPPLSVRLGGGAKKQQNLELSAINEVDEWVEDYQSDALNHAKFDLTSLEKKHKHTEDIINQLLMLLNNREFSNAQDITKVRGMLSKYVSFSNTLTEMFSSHMGMLLQQMEEII